MLQQNTIDTINSRLTNIPGVEKIILFGSQSRGTADKNSDIDLIILVDKFNDRYEMSRYIRKELSWLEYAFDIIVMTIEEYELDKNIPGTIARYAYKEGEILYAA